MSKETTVRDLILTAADPTTEGLSVVTRKELANREREDDEERRALDRATETLNNQRPLMLRWIPGLGALVLSLFGGCEQPPLKRAPQACVCTCPPPVMARPLVSRGAARDDEFDLTLFAASVAAVCQ